MLNPGGIDHPTTLQTAVSMPHDRASVEESNRYPLHKLWVASQPALHLLLTVIFRA